MNQTESMESSKDFKKKKTLRIVFIVVGVISILTGVFFLSFYLSYSKIATGHENNNTRDETMQEKEVKIVRLERELSEQDKEIKELRYQVTEYQNLIRQLQEKEEYAKAIMEEMKKLPQGRARAINLPGMEALEPSEVQNDLYLKPVRED